jgi:hypothetical protein
MEGIGFQLSASSCQLPASGFQLIGHPWNSWLEAGSWQLEAGSYHSGADIICVARDS